MSAPPSRITRHLYQGPWPHDMEAVYREFDAVVFLAQEMPPPPHRVPDGKHAFFLPYDDSFDVTKVPVAELQALALVLAQKIRMNKKVLVTCAMGLNRSGLLSALTIARAYGVPGETAIKRIQERRPGALRNRVYADLARKLAP